MRDSFKFKNSHLDKINNISNDMLISTRFLRNNSSLNINKNNTKRELLKKCNSTLISPQFKENYFNMIQGVIENNNIDVIQSYPEKKKQLDQFFLKNINQDERFNKKKAKILSMMNEKKTEKKTKKKSYLMFNSQKNIFKNDKIAFILNKKTFLNRFENVKNKLNKDLSNLSQKNILSISQRSSSTKTINDYKNANNRNLYSSFFRDSFLKNTNEPNVKLESKKKINSDLLKWKKKLNLCKF